MDKSIEEIWKEGFMKESALTIPKLNDLYNKKSKNIVDKLQRMFEINIAAIAVGTVLVVIGALYFNFLFLGAVLFIMMGWTCLIGVRNLVKFKELDKGVNSYQYLKSFDGLVKEFMATYAQFYRFLYPVLFVAFAVQYLVSDLGVAAIAEVVAKNPDTLMVADIPFAWIVGIVLIAGLISYFAKAIYKLDIRITYGSTFDKLAEILSDMEELSGGEKKHHLPT